MNSHSWRSLSIVGSVLCLHAFLHYARAGTTRIVNTTPILTSSRFSLGILQRSVANLWPARRLWIVGTNLGLKRVAFIEASQRLNTKWCISTLVETTNFVCVEINFVIPAV